MKHTRNSILKINLFRLALFSFLLGLSHSLIAANCKDTFEVSRQVYIATEMALSEIGQKKNFNQRELRKSMDEVDYFINKAINDSKTAMDLAYSCGCTTAFSSMEESLNFAHRSRNEETIEGMIYQIKRMQYFADEAMTFSEVCSL